LNGADEKRKKKVEVNEIYFDVVVSMEISRENGDTVDSKRIDFGKLKEDQVKGLTDIFSMMAANIEYLKKLAPQFERMDKSKPQYLD
jgi:Zn-finger domain-containing protein